MPTRIALSPEQGLILRELEEAGEETVGTILNTLKVVPLRDGSVPPETHASIAGLVDLGLLEWSGSPVAHCALARFDQEKQSWKSGVSSSGRPARPMLNHAGQHALVE